jgi:hypothetical protein
MSDYYSFYSLEQDVQIESIGALFKGANKTRWGINLQFFPPQNKRSLTVSYAPVLARKRVLNPTGESVPRGWKETFSISDTKSWKVAKIEDCPINGLGNLHDKDQFCFVFEIAGGKTIYLPQFELARALFLRDGYLARRALESKSLDLDFDIIRDWENGAARINVMPTSGYPLRHFNELQSRNYLSWILLDSQARKSFESISWYLNKHSYKTGGYWIWNFRFDPPELPGAYFSLRGRFDKKTGALFVYEIDKIRRIRTDVPNEIEMYHPEFSMPSPENAQDGNPAAPAEDIEGFRLHDDESANADRSRLIIQGEKVESEFTKAFITNRISKKKRRITSVIPDEDKGEGHVLDVSAEEPIVGQGRSGADWDTIKDLTDNVHLFESKFSCFLEMIKVMVNYDGCEKYSKTIYKLPYVPHCSKHRLSTDSNPRCMAVIELQVNGTYVTLLEVDTSDAEKAISTKVLVIRDHTTWKYDLQRITVELVRSSLVWPSKLLTQLCGKNGHIGIMHPRSVKSHNGLLLPDTIEGWAARCYGRIKRIL